MAASATATAGTNEHAAEATARRAGGLLAVHGIQSRTIGLELAWGRTPTEVPYIFYLVSCIYFLALLKKSKHYKIPKNDKNNKIKNIIK